MGEIGVAPIIVFVYNRYEHSKKTIEALAQNYLASESEVYIFVDFIEDIDARKKAEKLYCFLEMDDWKKYFKSVQITYANKHMGLANSVISGVTNIIHEYGKVIVLEDDIVTNPFFLQYMNRCLDFYDMDKKIWSISGYAAPYQKLEKTDEELYLSYRAGSWGWATWRDRWDSIDWDVKDYDKFRFNILKRFLFNRGGGDLSYMLDRQMHGQIDSWAVRWCYNQFKQKKYTVYPTQTYVDNIGFDGSGTNYTSAVVNNKATDMDYCIEPKSLKPKAIMLLYYNLYCTGSIISRCKRMITCARYNLKMLKRKEN